jgi:hypothetical protein
VYEFQSCADPAQRLYLANPEIASHAVNEVAVIRHVDSTRCWKLLGVSLAYGSAEIADITGWEVDCADCPQDGALWIEGYLINFWHMEEESAYIEVTTEWGFGDNTMEPAAESIDFEYSSDTGGVLVYDTLRLRYGVILRNCKIRARWDEVRAKWIVINLDSEFNTPTFTGQLIDTVPPDGIYETECVKLESRSLQEWYTWIEDPPESGDVLTVWAANPSLYSEIRGSVEIPLRVHGRLYTVIRDEEHKLVFEILSHLDPLAGAEGFVKLPDNNRGQALIHRYDSNATVADGGPCGDSEEPP